MAVWLDFLEFAGGTMDSGSSNGMRGTSDSRPRGPSGDPCIEELFVVSCVVSGVMTGDVCRELEVVTVDADAGTEEE